MHEAAWYTKAAMMPMRMAAHGWTVAQPAVMPTSAPRRELHVWPDQGYTLGLRSGLGLGSGLGFA